MSLLLQGWTASDDSAVAAQETGGITFDEKIHIAEFIFFIIIIFLLVYIAYYVSKQKNKQ